MCYSTLFLKLMSTSREVLLREVEAFLDASGMSPSVFGEKLMNDRHLVRRLRAGREVTLTTADRIRGFISENQKPASKQVARIA